MKKSSILVYVLCWSTILLSSINCNTNREDKNIQTSQCDTILKIRDNQFQEVYFGEEDNLFYARMGSEGGRVFEFNSNGDVKILNYVSDLGYHGPEIILDGNGRLKQYSYLSSKHSDKIVPLFQYVYAMPENIVKGQLVLEDTIRNDSLYVVVPNLRQAHYRVLINSKSVFDDFLRHEDIRWGFHVKDFSDTTYLTIEMIGLYNTKDSVFSRTYIYPGIFKLKNK